MIHISVQFYSSGGTSSAGGAGGKVAENTAKNLEIDSSKDWINNLKVQGTNPASGADNLTKEKRIDLIMEQLKISRNEAEKYAMALEEYGKNKPMSKKAAKDLETFIKKAPRWAGGETYHSLDANADTFSKSDNIGETISLRGTSTWYSNKGNVKGDVRMVSETQSKGTGINHLSVHSGEKEVLASDEARYKIKKKYWEGRVLYVQVEEI